MTEVTLAQQVKVTAALNKQKEMKKNRKLENNKTPMMKYLKTQVRRLSLSPLFLSAHSIPFPSLYPSPLSLSLSPRSPFLHTIPHYSFLSLPLPPLFLSPSLLSPSLPSLSIPLPSLSFSPLSIPLPSLYPSPLSLSLSPLSIPLPSLYPSPLSLTCVSHHEIVYFTIALEF